MYDQEISPSQLKMFRKKRAFCRFSSKLKPKFYRPSESSLIKATWPMKYEFKRVSLYCYCGELLTNILIFQLHCHVKICIFQRSLIVLKTTVFVESLQTTFHSHISRELNENLRNVATSNSTPYPPQANGQSEQYVDVIWKIVGSALKWSNLTEKEKHSEQVPQKVLSQDIPLSCTVANCIYHGGFFKFPKRTYGNLLPSSLMSRHVLEGAPQKSRKFGTVNLIVEIFVTAKKMNRSLVA